MFNAIWAAMEASVSDDGWGDSEFDGYKLYHRLKGIMQSHEDHVVISKTEYDLLNKLANSKLEEVENVS